METKKLISQYLQLVKDKSTYNQIVQRTINDIQKTVANDLKKPRTVEYLKNVLPLVNDLIKYTTPEVVRIIEELDNERKNKKPKIMQFELKFYIESADNKGTRITYNNKTYKLWHTHKTPAYMSEVGVNDVSVPFENNRIAIGSKLFDIIDNLKDYETLNDKLITTLQNFSSSADVSATVFENIREYVPPTPNADIQNTTMHGAIVLHDESISYAANDCDYVIKNRHVGSCVYDAIINTYWPSVHKRVGDRNNAGQDIKDLLTYNGLYKLFNNAEPNETSDWGVSCVQLGKFFEKLKLSVVVKDVFDNNIYELLMTDKNRNKKITPQTMYIKMSHEHAFQIDKPMWIQSHFRSQNKTGMLTDKYNTDFKLNNDKVIVADTFDDIMKVIATTCGVPCNTQVIKVQQGNAFEGYDLVDTIVRPNYNDILTQCMLNEQPKKTIKIITNTPLFDVVKELYAHNHLPKIGRFITMFFGDIMITVSDSSGSHGITYIDNEDHYAQFNKLMHMARTVILNPKFKSQYSPQVAAMYRKYFNANYVGTPTAIEDVRALGQIYNIDYSKFYTSILRTIKKVPVIYPHNKFTRYTGQPIRNDDQYYVKCDQPNIIYGSTYNLVYGETLIKYPVDSIEGASIQILAVMEVDCTYDLKNEFDQVVRSIYAADTYRNAKTVLNMVIGNLGKSKNRVSSFNITNSDNEAYYMASKYGGMAHRLSDNLYLHANSNEIELVDGFLLIRNLIYERARDKLNELAKKCSMYMQVVCYNTDCVYVVDPNNHIDEFRKLDTVVKPGMSDFDSIGLVKITRTDRIINRMIDYNYNANILELDESTIQKIQITNEWDTKSANSEFVKLPNLTLITALFPGCGKSRSLKDCIPTMLDLQNIPKTINSKGMDTRILFASPYNALRQKIRREGFQACTVAKLLTMFRKKRNNKININEIKVIVIDEIGLLTHEVCTAVNRLAIANPHIMYYATMDVRQLKPIQEDKAMNINNANVKCIMSMFKYYITLEEIKRIKDPVQREKAKKIFTHLQNETSSEEAVKYLISNNIVRTVNKISDVWTTTNIANYNGTVSRVNAMFEQNKTDAIRLHSESPDTVYVCKRDRRTANSELYLNDEYIVLAINGEDVIMVPNDFKDDVSEQRIVKKKDVLYHFDVGYGRTIYCYQGWNIDGEFTIFDADKCDMSYLYTAITRCTDLNNIIIYTGDELKNEIIYDRDIEKRIELHKRADIIANRDVSQDYITVDYVRDMMRVYRCWMCAKHLCKQTYSIDRIDDRLAHVVGNCRMSCLTCNLAKSNKTVV